MQLPMLPQDKANHAIYGAAIALTAAVLTAVGFGAVHMAPLVALAAAAIAGAAKEGSDWWQNRKAGAEVHGVDPYDFVATAAGGLVVALAAWL